LPPDPGARHLSAARPVIVLWLVFVRADLQAAEASRLVAAVAAGATGPPATTATSPAVPAASPVPTAAIIATSALRRCDAIDCVVILTACDRAVGSLLALEHAHEAHFIKSVSNDIKCFDHPGGPVGLDGQCSGDRVDDRIRLLLGRRVRYRRITGRRSRRLRGCLGITGRRIRGCVTCRGVTCRGVTCRGVTCRGVTCRGITRSVLRCVHRIVELCGWCTHVRAARGGACSRRLAQGKRRELGERLHGRLATPKASETPGLRWSDRAREHKTYPH
jgi:hypothetical protein